MNEALKLILSLSLSGSILAVIVFVMKGLIRHKLSKSVQYYIWIIVLVRLILPFSNEGSIMNDLFYKNSAPITITSQNIENPATVIGENDRRILILPNVNRNLANGVYNYDSDHSRYIIDLFSQYVFYFWFLGVIITLAVNLTGYVKFLIQLNKGNKEATEAEQEMLMMLLNGQRNVKLVRNGFATTPMLIGMIRPQIIIPDVDYDGNQLKNILLHEIAHLKRFDIGVKWLTLIATSIHWFNPLMHFIKKEINHACELACDEVVIKKLNDEEKQAYGETLIAVVAENKYPTGVLQATMSEEKRTLKERLISIMNHRQKSRMIVLISFVLLAGTIISAVALGAGVGKSPLDVVYENDKYDFSITLSKAFLKDIEIREESNAIYFIDKEVQEKYPEQIFGVVGRIEAFTKAAYTKEEMLEVGDSYGLRYLGENKNYYFGWSYATDLQVPLDATEQLKEKYRDLEKEFASSIQTFKLKEPAVNDNFESSNFNYDLIEIAKHKTPYIGDSGRVTAIVGNLPVPDEYFKQQYISMKTTVRPYHLTIYHEPASDTEAEVVWPRIANYVFESNLNKNALVLFSMIDNLDEVTFAFRDSQSYGKLDMEEYEEFFTFQREPFEKEFGALSALGDNLDQLQKALTGKSVFTDSEVAAALDVVSEYYRVLMAKDDKAILKTLTPKYNKPNVVLYGNEIRTLLSVTYNPEDSMRESYVKYGNGSVNGTELDNVIVFRVSFNIAYPQGLAGAFEEGDYTDWSMILIREDKDSPWLIDDQGY